MKKTSYFKANLILNLLVATLLSAFVVNSQVMLAGGWSYSFRPVLMTLLSALVLSLVLHSFYGLLFWTIAWKKHVPAMLGAYVLATLVLIFNTYYFGLNGQHLDLEGWSLTFNGWLAGEIGNPVVVPLAILAVCILAYGLFWLLFQGLGKLTRWAPFRGIVPWVVVLFLLPGISLTVARLYVPSDFRMTELGETLPWSSLFGVGSQIDFSQYRFFEDPESISIQSEIESMRKAAAALDQLPAKIDAERKPNILILGIEGWRFDMLNAETTPKLSRWLDKGFIQLPHHYSTGNTTPSSMFGLLSGLNGFFYQAHLETGRTSFLSNLLRRMGYKQTAWDIMALKYNNLFEKQFKPSGFTLQSNRELDLPKWQKDSLLLNRLADSLLASDNQSPRLDFFLYYSTHYNYFYPESFAKFQPAADIDGLNSGLKPNLRVYREQIFNKYKNSILYMDNLIDQLLTKLEKAGRLENSIVVITGDHGEEFWEDGTFGHSFRLDDWQTRTASMIRFPTPITNSYTTTSHADFLPTAFDYMGVKADWRSFATGKSLLAYQPEEDYAVVLKGGKEKYLAFRASLVQGDYKIYFQNRWNLNQNLEEVRFKDSTIHEFPIDTVRQMLAKIPRQKLMSGAR